MKIRALLPPEAIIVRADVQTKEAAIDLLAELHDQVGHLSDKEAYERDVWKREGECVTAIGMGMAVPHAKSDAVKQAGLAPSPSQTASTAAPWTGSPPACCS